MLNAMAKFDAHKASTNNIVSLQDQYISVTRVLISSQTISSAQLSLQGCMLLNLSQSQMSRSVEAVNGPAFKQVVLSVITDKAILENMLDDQSAPQTGIKSHIRKRQAYLAFV